MSVIIKGMEIPKSCSECELSSPINSASPWKKYCDVDVKDVTNEFDNDTKRSDCPLKSTEKLIEKILSINVQVSPETETDCGEMSAGEMRRKCISVIKNYCGEVEE